MKILVIIIKTLSIIVPVTIAAVFFDVAKTKIKGWVPAQSSSNKNTNFLKLKKLVFLPIKISYKKLQKIQKMGLFLYVLITLYRGFFFTRYFFYVFFVFPFSCFYFNNVG